MTAAIVRILDDLEALQQGDIPGGELRAQAIGFGVHPELRIGFHCGDTAMAEAERVGIPVNHRNGMNTVVIRDGIRRGTAERKGLGDLHGLTVHEAVVLVCDRRRRRLAVVGNLNIEQLHGGVCVRETAAAGQGIRVRRLIFIGNRNGVYSLIRRYGLRRRASHFKSSRDHHPLAICVPVILVCDRDNAILGIVGERHARRTQPAHRPRQDHPLAEEVIWVPGVDKHAEILAVQTGYAARPTHIVNEAHDFILPLPGSAKIVARFIEEYARDPHVPPVPHELLDLVQGEGLGDAILLARRSAAAE